jgi:hypothetical protein
MIVIEHVALFTDAYGTGIAGRIWFHNEWHRLTGTMPARHTFTGVAS